MIPSPKLNKGQQMENGKVLSLYMTVPDLMRSGHRMMCDSFDCDPQGILGDIKYESGSGYVMLLVCKSTYDIIDEAELMLDYGTLLENIYVDIDLYHLKPGSIIEIGDNLFEVNAPCEDYRYLYAFAPEIPDLIRGKRGLFITPIEYCNIQTGDPVTIIKEA